MTRAAALLPLPLFELPLQTTSSLTVIQAPGHSLLRVHSAALNLGTGDVALTATMQRSAVGVLARSRSWSAAPATHAVGCLRGLACAAAMEDRLVQELPAQAQVAALGVLPGARNRLHPACCPQLCLLGGSLALADVCHSPQALPSGRGASSALFAAEPAGLVARPLRMPSSYHSTAISPGARTHPCNV